MLKSDRQTFCSFYELDRLLADFIKLSTACNTRVCHGYALFAEERILFLRPEQEKDKTHFTDKEVCQL